MKKYMLILLGVVFCVAASLAAQDQESIWKSSDEAYLIQVLEKPGDAPEDIFLKNLACKRLAVIGTEKAIPALTAMLPNEKLNLNARTALEAMPCSAVDKALIASLKSDLQGWALVGVIDTLAMRKTEEAVEPISEILASTDDASVKKAAYNALGYIANEQATNILTAELGKDQDADYSVGASLADALLRVSATLAQSGDSSRAAEICALVAKADLPGFDKNGGLYNELLNLHANAAEKIEDILKNGNDNDFEVALKTIREYADSDAEPVVKAVLNTFEQLSKERQVLLIAALGDRTDSASRQLVLPFVQNLLQNGEGDILEAAVKASGHCGEADPISVYDSLAALFQKESILESWDSVINAIVALPDEIADKPALLIAERAAGNLSDLSEAEKAALIAQIQILGLRRIEVAGPDLLKIANAEGVDSAVRDQAVAALSEIVSLNDLGILVQALRQETDPDKVDWNLRAACTRLPREDCAAEIVKLFNEAAPAEKLSFLPLLKQIGGPTALAAVVKASEDPAVADKATEILGQWNTPEDAAPLAAACLKLAKESQQYKTRAIRAYIRIPRQFDIPADQKIKMAKIAFDTASRHEDKVLVFEILRRIVDISSVEAALDYTSDPEYCENACAAAVFVAEKIKETSPELQDAMKKVLELAKGQELKDRAAKVLERK